MFVPEGRLNASIVPPGLFGEKRGKWRPSSELLGYCHLSLRDINVGNDKARQPWAILSQALRAISKRHNRLQDNIL